MNNKILIVDNEEINRDILGEFLENSFNVETVCNGKDALDRLYNAPDEYLTMLLDINMPIMDGFEVLEKMNENNLINKIPVIVITGEKSDKNEKKCYELGAKDFIYKPFSSYSVVKKVENMISISRNYQYMQEKIDNQTERLNEQYAVLIAQNKKLSSANQIIIDALGNLVELKNIDGGLHIARVRKLTQCLCSYVERECPQYSLSQKKIEMIVMASPLHDLGKISIPDRILEKKEKLSNDEYDYVKSHTLRGCSLLKNIYDMWDDELKKVCYEICRSHHERYDGKGYPDGLKGDEIPISAQIVSITDVYEALVSSRSYKDAYDYETASNMIINGECGIFSPDILKCFCLAKKEFEMICDETKEN